MQQGWVWNFYVILKVTKPTFRWTWSDHVILVNDLKKLYLPPEYSQLSKIFLIKLHFFGVGGKKSLLLGTPLFLFQVKSKYSFRSLCFGFYREKRILNKKVDHIIKKSVKNILFFNTHFFTLYTYITPQVNKRNPHQLQNNKLNIKVSQNFCSYLYVTAKIKSLWSLPHGDFAHLSSR